MSPMSLKPSEAVEGGDFPRGNLVVIKARYGVFEYKDRDGNAVKNAFGGDARSMAALLELENEAGTVFNQAYSVGRPDKFSVLQDGKVLEGQLNKGCNFMKLLAELVKKGYPEDRLQPDVAASLEGLAGYWDQGTGVNGDDSKLILPREIHRFPWDGEQDKLPGFNGGTTNGATETDTSAMEVAVGMVKELLESKDEHTRQKLATNTFGLPLPESTKQAVMNIVFSPELAKALEQEGIHLDGEQFVR